MSTTSDLFLLACGECGARGDVESIDQATAEGWAGIDYAPHLPTANFVGLCPECRERFGHWPTAEDRTDG